MSAPLETTLPKLYAGWMAELLDDPIPAERNATCLDCAMLAPADEAANNSALYYHPQAKCCTYVPQLPNFLVGCVLSDDDPALDRGRASIMARIESGGTATPLWLDRPPGYDLKYDLRDHFFGRLTGLRCPHYLEEGGGLCSIWRYREAVCTTFFCKHVRGAVGQHFWESLKQLLLVAERDLAYWCALELGIEPAVLRRFLPANGMAQVIHLMELEQEETHLRLKTQGEVWGSWQGRKPEFFAACARLVEPLGWAEVVAIAGPELRLRASLTSQAHRRLLADSLPERLRLGSFQLIQMQPEFNLVQSYINTDLLRIPRQVWEVLPYFDGRPTAQAIQIVAAEKGVKINPSLIRKLVDFEILRPVEAG